MSTPDALVSAQAVALSTISASSPSVSTRKSYPYSSRVAATSRPSALAPMNPFLSTHTLVSSNGLAGA